MQIKVAVANDAQQCVDLVEARRIEYEIFQPRFWKKAASSAASTLTWFEALFGDDRAVCFVAVEDKNIVGFIIAREFPTPPVYDPGGPTALVDDFCVASKDRWTEIGQALLRETRSALKERGFAQVVVVGAIRDLPKTEFLDQTDLSLASTWWTAAV